MSVKYQQILNDLAIMSKHLQRAAQNREELLNAAAEMIKAHGIHVPLQMIIDYVGVGRATFYRNFADRKHLIYALLTICHTYLHSKNTGAFSIAAKHSYKNSSSNISKLFNR